MNNNKRIAVNSVIIFVRLCVTTLVAIFASRIVLDALGASDYGLYNVVGGIVTILNVVNSAMLSTTYRYIAFEIGRGENGNSNKVFNTSVAIHACFALFILLLAVTIGEYYISNYLNVLPEKLDDARFVFRISVMTTVVSTILVPYKGLLVAYEKFSVTAILDIAAQLFKLLAVFLILYEAPNKIRAYSLIMMIYTLIECGGYFIYGNKKYYSTVKLKLWSDWKLYKEMLSFAVWTLFGAVASIGKNQGSAIILNFFFGTLVNAAFAVANQVNNFITMFARSLDNAAIPQITKSFSGGEKDRSYRLASYISKYTFFLMLLVAFPVLLEMDFLLGLWLKEVPEGSTIFCQIIILTALLDCLGEGIPAIVNATGDIKKYQIIFHSFTILGLPIAFLLCKLGFGQYTLVWVFCVIMGLSAILRLYLLKKIYNIDIKMFIETSYIKMFYVSIPLLIFFIIYDSSSFSLWGHIIGMVGSELVLLPVIYVLGLEKKERSIILQCVKNFSNHLHLHESSKF